MTTWHVTDADRDASGRIRIRSLRDLLPPARSPGSAAAYPPPGRPAILDGRGAAVVAGLLLALALIALVARDGASPPRLIPSPVPTDPAPAASPVPPPPTALPPPRPVGSAWLILPWTVDAFDRSGHYVGPLDAGRTYTITGRIDTVWLAIEAPAFGGAPASGPVRVRAADLLTPPRAYGPTPPPPPPPPPAPRSGAILQAPPTAAPPPAPAGHERPNLRAAPPGRSDKTTP